MVDFGSKITGFIKNETQDFAQKTVGKLAGSLSGMGGGVINSLIGSVAQGLSQNLMSVGNAFDTVEAVAAQKLDGIVAGGDPEYAAGGRCADRSTAADISSMRNPGGGSLMGYAMNVFPDTKVDAAYSTSTDRDIVVLTEQSETYYMKLRFYEYERKDLFKRDESSDIKYSITFPLPMELIDRQGSKGGEVDLFTVGNLLDNSGGDLSGTSTAAALNAGQGLLGSTIDTLTSKIPGGGLISGAGINGRNIVNSVEQQLGVAPNPNPSYVYSGPSLREITFNWMFNPRNREESKRLKLAIKKMKASSLGATAFANDTGLLRYPNVAMVNFYPWDSSPDTSSGTYGWGEESFIRMKRCVVTSINSNFAPTGAPVFFAGSRDPVYISLSINLKEIEFFTAEDWGGESGGGVDVASVKNSIDTLGHSLWELGGNVSKAAGL